MINIEKPNLKSLRKAPFYFWALILLFFIVGIWVQSYMRENELKKIQIDNITMENQTPFSIDVIFDVINNTRQCGKKAVLIEAYTNQNYLISSKLVNIEINPKSKSRHVKVLDKFYRRLNEDENISSITVKLYHRSAF